MRYCAARASLTKGAIYSWHKAQPSIRITYHTAAPFPNAILKGLDRRSPCTPFHNITLWQYSYWTLQANLGSTDDPDALEFLHISPIHIITSRSLHFRYSLKNFSMFSHLSTSSQIQSVQYKYLCNFVVFPQLNTAPSPHRA